MMLPASSNPPTRRLGSRMRLNPITRKRLRRFREMRRAWWSFWILLALYAISLASELVAGNTPLYVRFRGHHFFPLFRFYPDDRFTGSGKQTRPDYKQISRSEAFQSEPGNRMIFPPIPYGPTETIRPEDIDLPDEVVLVLTREPLIGILEVDKEGRVQRAESCRWFTGLPDDHMLGRSLDDIGQLPATMQQALAMRFGNQEAPYLVTEVAGKGGRKAFFSLATFVPRTEPPARVRFTLREPNTLQSLKERIRVPRDGPAIPLQDTLWKSLEDTARDRLLLQARQRFEETVPDQRLKSADHWIRARFIREDVRFPFRPVRGHPLGLDSAGRDVLVRILYGLRTSLTFGFLLVAATIIVGIAVGALQGYYGGLTDLIGQRLVEIWESLPFLYILILMGSVFGRSFTLLLVCYGVFNWVGISYYMRAEFLRLRRQPFVEAAWCLGLPNGKIIFRHILPNALVPVITFFPFSLVGAVGVLTALDYLGFGLPPPTASWGELLSQAQEYNWAWWLSLYPSLALFLVMLLGVFVGEGVRSAFDPRKFSRLE